MRFPRLTFGSTAFTGPGPDTYALAGLLTIRDFTRPLTLAVRYGRRSSFRRQDFGRHLLSKTGALVSGNAGQRLLSVELRRQEA